jgi:hypothetical protein
MEGSGSDDVMDFSAAAAEEPVEEAPAPAARPSVHDRPAPKERPSAPKFKKQRSLSGPIVLIVLLLAIGVGGYVGWPMLSAYLADRSEPERPQVVLPAIPAELVPQMRSVADAAIGDVVAQVSEATRVADAPTQPHDDWLSGVYLGNASQYAGIGSFWVSMEAFLEGLRAAEWQLYHDKYVDRMGGEGLDAETAALLTERADSGFVAAQPQRREAYAELDRLVGAALDLHDFLVANEAEILFRPGVTSASDPSVDPVLEIAAPADDRTRMLAMFDDITDALDGLGSLDRVTRDRLVAAMTARLRQVGIQ